MFRLELQQSKMIKIYLLALIGCLVMCRIQNLKDVDWRKVQDQIAYYHGEGAFAGGIVRVSTQNKTVFNEFFGTFTREMSPFSVPSFRNDTMMDIASLTKVTATLSCIMQLFEEGKLKLEDKVTKFIPEYGNNGKEQTTIKNLLLHNAGLLPDYIAPLPKIKKEVMDWVYNCTLNYPISSKFVYSDLSFILLGEISERITGLPLKDYAKQLVERMGMHNTTYLPDLTKNLYRIPPTEYSSFRQHLIRGEVHDPTAYLFGGVAGHAGFYSIAEDLQRYMQIHLRKGLHPNGTRIYQEQTVETFYKRQDGLPYNNRRALGWDTVPIQDHPPCGNLFSLNSFGHTGYTGTMIWADRDKGIIVMILTQRVHPTSGNLLILEARAKIVDQIVMAMGID